MPINYPGSLDSLSNPTATTRRDDPGFELDVVISQLNDIAEALQAKLGIGASLPAAGGGVLRQTGSGASAWGKLQSGDIASGAVPLTKLLEFGPLGVGVTSVSFDFTSIPATFRHLRIVYQGRCNASGVSAVLTIRLNGITAALYMDQNLQGTAASASAFEHTGLTYMDLAAVTAAGAVAGSVAEGILEIPNYALLSPFTKHVVALASIEWGNTVNTRAIRTGIGSYFGTLVVNQVTLAPIGGSWTEGSVATLYGY